MRQAGIAAQAGGDNRRLDAGRLAGGIGGRGVLPVVAARQARQFAQVDNRIFAAFDIVVQDAVAGEDAAAGPAQAGDRHDDLLAGLAQFPAQTLADLVVDADHRRPRRGLAMEDQALGVDVAFEAAVPFQVVAGDVEQHRHVEGDGERQLELEARHLEHVEPTLVERLEQQGRGPQIAADLSFAARALQHVADQGGGGGLAVGAGHPDVAGVTNGARQQLDIADDLAVVLAGEGGHRMGFGVEMGNARRDHQAGQLLPVAPHEVDQGDAVCRRRRAAVFVVVPGPNFGAAFLQGLGGREPGAAETEHGDGQAGEVEEIDHRRPLTAVSRWRGRPGRGSRR